ncbi:MAG: bifunctional phosphopantothenoylcysteine decarboxylase/phosphopantothenate--cysteine ligase CoaBC [Thermodesulfobacteriota bacterium]
MALLRDKKILLGISGGIAAYKTGDWVRDLRREGCEVRVVMTQAACRFIPPLTMAALSGNRVHVEMFAPEDQETIPHISLARWADLVLVAPATADTIARLAHGRADDLLATVILAATAPVLVCPAMNSAMYRHPATQANLATLQGYGYRVVPPECGSMACGEEGPGRLAEWASARQAIGAALLPQDLAGLQVVVTAGPTQEPIDPARFLSNRSSGKMGYALAAAARQRGATVTLISGPSPLSPPPGAEFVPVTTAMQMQAAVLSRIDQADVIIKAAAVADFRPSQTLDHKAKKGEIKTSLPMTANPDILKELGQMKKQRDRFPLLVGFAAETRDHQAEGARKLQEKNLDLMVINDIAASDSGFGVDTNRVTLLDRESAVQELPLLDKEEVAHRILERVAAMAAKRC